MDYQIRPLGKQCAATGKALEPGARVYSVILDHEGELVRADYSEAGWTGPPEGTVGQWMSVVPDAAPEKPKGLDPEEMLTSLEQLLEDANPAQEKLAYVLALFLLQRRRLKLDGSRVDGEAEYLLLSGSRGEGPYEVRDQQLSNEEITRLQAEVTHGMQSESQAA